MPLAQDQVELLAIAKRDSDNEKTGRVAVTYAAQASCPTSCRFFNGGGCYAENGRLAMKVTLPLNHAGRAQQAGPVEVAEAEARAIDALEPRPGQPMRLHTVGDCRTDKAARIVAAAAHRYMERGGGRVWTYTHAWQIVDRASWGRVSVLASCETAEQVELARTRGYAPSIVVPEFESRRKYLFGPLSVLPCPAQTTDGVTCESCRLCMDDQGIMSRGYAIGFAVHGTALSVKKALRALEAPNDPRRRLTSRDFIEEFLAQEGRWPNIREVRDGAGVNWASAAEMLARMREERDVL